MLPEVKLQNVYSLGWAFLEDGEKEMTVLGTEFAKSKWECRDFVHIKPANALVLFPTSICA